MIADQVINGSKNYLYIESSCFLFSPNLAEKAILTFSKDNCQQDTFEADLFVCDSKIGIFFNLVRCLERQGEWTIELKQSDTILLKDIMVQVNGAPN